MKRTPREILLGHSQTALPKLEAMREQVLAQAAEPAGGVEKQAAEPLQQPPLRRINLWWSELFWPRRFSWLSLATVWAGILVLNLLTIERGQPASAPAPLSAQAVEVLREQRRLLAELISEPAAPGPDTRPQPLGPRSDRRVRRHGYA